MVKAIMQHGLPKIVSRIAITNLVYGDYYEATPICPLCGRPKEGYYARVCHDCYTRYGDKGAWVICCAMAKLDRDIWDGNEVEAPPEFLSHAYKIAVTTCNGSKSADDLLFKLRSLDEFKHLPRRFLKDVVKRAYADTRSREEYFHQENLLAPPTISDVTLELESVKPEITTSTELAIDTSPEISLANSENITLKEEQASNLAPARIIRLPKNIRPSPQKGLPMEDPILSDTKDVYVPSIFFFVKEEEVRKLMKFAEREFRMLFSKARLFSVRYKTPVNGCQSAVLVFQDQNQQIKFVLCYVYKEARKGRRAKDSTPHLEWIHALREEHKSVIKQIPRAFRNMIK